MPEKRGLLTPKAAEMLAVDALAWLAGEPDALGRFLALSGLGPTALRAAASDPGFLAGVLDYFASDERVLMAYAKHAGIPPGRIGTAQRTLNGHD